MNFNIFISDPQTTVASTKMNDHGHVPGGKIYKGQLVQSWLSKQNIWRSDFKEISHWSLEGSP